MDISSYTWGVATASLSMRPEDTIERKFTALQAAGFKNCELGFSGYMEWVRQQRPDLPPSTAPHEWAEAGEPDPSDEEIWKALFDHVPAMLSLAKSYDIKILMLQPLNQFEGWAAGSKRADWCRRKAERWMPLCSALGVEQIQVGSNDLLPADFEDAKVAEDMRWLAQFSSELKPPVKIAYENWSFGDRISSIEHAWKIVQMADHPNFGLCLDTAHFPLTLGYGWNPRTGEGWTEADFQNILSFIRALPVEKIFYVELSDVLPPVIPLGQGSPFDEWCNNAKTSRGDRFLWAMVARPVPLIGRDAGRSIKAESDMGGERVVEALRVILETGYNGPLMFEPFEALSMEQGNDVPALYAQACAKAKQRLIEAIKQG
ncbi:hypothetical protein I352_02167 [Cryptococcus deuterogattii MMRL2647]|nr:hypothetical protein I352_02167 [Cryptococcus deuterogattii MMRL2647]